MVNLDDDVAQLCYGTYYRRSDPKTGRAKMPRRLKEDLAAIAHLGMPGNGEGQALFFFRSAAAVRMPQPDPGNPAWRLSRAPGIYSLQVAAFEPTVDFWEHQQAATAFCALLRRRGYQAYYHHGQSLSMVTVGSFGADAVRHQQRGLPTYSRQVIELQRDRLLKHNLVNGKIIRRKLPQGGSVAIPSQLVRIPGRELDESW